LDNINNQAQEVAMANKQTPVSRSIPSTEAENQHLPVEPIELPTAEIANSPLTVTPVYQEVLAWGEDSHYSRHWGINE
jgi:hypothetical protein